MHKPLVLFLFTILILCSCSKKKDKLPCASSGKINTISVVIDDKLWNGIIGDSIRNKFANPVDGLPKEEPQFNINQYPTNLMEGFMTKSRTIIVIKKEDKNAFITRKDQYASPQNVFHLSGKTISEILQLIEKNAPNIIQIIKKGEIIQHQRLLNDSILDPKKITKKFKIGIKVPSSYSFILEKDNFVWMKKEFMSGSSSLLISQLPVNAIKNKSDITETILKIQDSIGALYINGAEANSTMTVDRSYPVYFFKTKIDNKVTYQIKGTWRLKDSFMFGPFVNYMIVDPDKNRVVILVGFCYSPSRDKRDFMHELESIVQGVQIQ